MNKYQIQHARQRIDDIKRQAADELNKKYSQVSKIKLSVLLSSGAIPDIEHSLIPRYGISAYSSLSVSLPESQDVANRCGIGDVYREYNDKYNKIINASRSAMDAIVFADAKDTAEILSKLAQKLSNV